MTETVVNPWSRRVRLIVCAIFVVMALGYVWNLQNTLSQQYDEIKIQQNNWQQKQQQLNDRLTQQEALLRTLDGNFASVNAQPETWVLLDLEQTLGLVNQKLQIQGSVEASLTLLDLARRRLDNARIPHKETVKNALAQDMALLRTYRTRDTSDLFTQIDSLLKIIDDLPLKLELTSDPAKIKNVKKTETPFDIHALMNSWWIDLRNLIRLNPVGDGTLMSTTQMNLVRSQLRLNLLTARMAVLMQQSSLAQQQLQHVEKTLNMHADIRASVVKETLALLSRSREEAQKIGVPALTRTLAEIQKLR